MIVSAYQGASPSVQIARHWQKSVHNLHPKTHFFIGQTYRPHHDPRLLHHSSCMPGRKQFFNKELSLLILMRHMHGVHQHWLIPLWTTGARSVTPAAGYTSIPLGYLDFHLKIATNVSNLLLETELLQFPLLKSVEKLLARSSRIMRKLQEFKGPGEELLLCN
ncbi:hypothetical protein VNO77_26975 [Canavalia gladiata]|uniref:Uncharacterized protein n=1 Tax=Canavalia gladiata TaxID=3824 RepID=A0AAN9KWZ0_CANGL